MCVENTFIFHNWTEQHISLIKQIKSCIMLEVLVKQQQHHPDHSLCLFDLRTYWKEVVRYYIIEWLLYRKQQWLNGKQDTFIVYFFQKYILEVILVVEYFLYFTIMTEVKTVKHRLIIKVMIESS